MKVIWKGEKLCDWAGLPTIKEMRKVKAELGIRNPVTFMNAALATGTLDDGEESVFDLDAFAMFIALASTRGGKAVNFEDVDGELTDLQVERSPEEIERLKAAEGKDEGNPSTSADTSTTSTEPSSPEPSGSGDSTD